MHYDVVVLGAGSGGYVAAIRAAQLNLKVAIVEVQYWGGVCLNVGCIPSKALLRNAEIAHLLQHQASLFGIEGAITMRYDAAFDRSRMIATARVKGLRYLMRKNKIDEYEGKGTFTDRHSLRVDGEDGAQILRFDNAITATGARPKMWPGRVLPNEGLDVSKELAKAYRGLGVQQLMSTRIVKAVESDSAVTLSYQQDRSDVTEMLTVDAVLVAAGFSPNVVGYGLEVLGVETDSRNAAIVIDETMATSVTGIYAIGDVTAKMMLAHVAEAQGIIAAETIAQAPTVGIDDYAMMPRRTFCQP